MGHMKLYPEKLMDWLDKVIENRKELNSLCQSYKNISLGYITDNEIMVSKGIEYMADYLAIPLTYGKPFLSEYENKMKRKILFFYNGYIFSSFIYDDSYNKEREEKTMSYTDNPVHDFNMHDAEQEGKLQALQKCDLCGEPIQQEMSVCFEGKYICDDCLKKLRRVI